MKAKKLLALILAMLMMLSVLSACGSSEDDTPDTPSADDETPEAGDNGGSEDGEEGEVYKIACIAPLTGSSAEHGESYRTAIEYKLKEINDAGGINGRQIVCEFYDDKGDSKETVNCATLVAENDEYLACFGSFSSTCSIAAAATLTEAGIAQFAPSTSHVDFTSLSEYQIRGCNTSEIQQRFYAKFLYNFYGARNIVFNYLNDDAGNSTLEYFDK